MEKYIFNGLDDQTIKFGKYTNRTFEKHKDKYGEFSAIKTRDTARKIYLKSKEQVLDSSKNNNMLLIGKVQSGKTSCLEMLSSIAFDNDYNCLIMYGGYDKKLLLQTKKRFMKIFNIEEDDLSTDTPILLVTEDKNSVENFDDTLLEAIIDSEKPIIIISMKNVSHFKNLNKLLINLIKEDLKCMIIDDEGDQASLNTEIKKKKFSPTYTEIVKMKKELSDPIYFSVTATPQANVFLGEYSELKPSTLRLIEPSSGYIGAEIFHTNEKSIVTVKEDEVLQLNKHEVPESLTRSLYYFLVASAIMNFKGYKYTDMIIHTSGITEDHDPIYDALEFLFNNLKKNIKRNSDDLNIQIDDILSVYSEDYFDPNVLMMYEKDLVKKEVVKIIKHTYIILQNSKGEVTQSNLKLKFHKIYVGGNLLQRGLTFEYLITTFFTRWPKQGNMDTVMQRARWFGYRDKYKELCKIFTTDLIKKEFNKLTEIEINLWDQFQQVQNGKQEIDDILIDSMDSSLVPTRRNVVDYRRVGFSRKWYAQRIGIFDKIILDNNSKHIELFLNSYKFSASSVGRNDEKISNYYSVINNLEFLNLIDKCDIIFDTPPFRRTDLKSVLKEPKIIIQKMFDLEGKVKEIRERSFDDSNCITALQQGADTVDLEKITYYGDSSVIVDETAVTIQIFKIRPKKEEIRMPDYDQYMFAIHVPVKGISYEKVKK